MIHDKREGVIFFDTKIQIEISYQSLICRTDFLRNIKFKYSDSIQHSVRCTSLKDIIVKLLKYYHNLVWTYLGPIRTKTLHIKYISLIQENLIFLFSKTKHLYKIMRA